MDDGSNREVKRLILFTEAALADLANIDNATAAMWGEAQAERYIFFLKSVLSSLSVEPSRASKVEQRPEFSVYTARYSRHRSGYGHRIFFREIAGGIVIIRILHTAMYWPEQLPRKTS